MVIVRNLLTNLNIYSISFKFNIVNFIGSDL